MNGSLRDAAPVAAPADKIFPARAHVLFLSAILIAVLAACLPVLPVHASGYVQENLVSDIPGMALQTDPNLVNPWGMAFSPTSPIWVADNHTGLSTLYRGNGDIVPLVVTVPPPAGAQPPAAPTGMVFNGSTSSFSGDRFIFATEDGTISGWQAGTAATLRADISGSGGVYKGLASGTSGGNDYLYAANFHAGSIDVYDSGYAPHTLAGSFVDPNLPAGYAPFDIQNLGGMLYVTYAQQDALGHDDISGPGHGFLDVFNTDGMLVHRAITGGALNSPWGLAIAPSNFGIYSNAFLVGNFGDGRINAFNPTTFSFLGSLGDEQGNPLSIEGLWGLKFGNGSGGAETNSLFFTAGISGGAQVEDHGLFGKIAPVPEPSSVALLLVGLAGLAVAGRKVRKR